MTLEQSAELFELDRQAEMDARKFRSDPVLAELIKVLAPFRGGLRRWSVMQAIRKEREKTSRDISHKFEIEVERTFRRFCADGETGACDAKDALFYRPKEKAGEVWCLYPERARAWLDAETRELR